MAEPEVDVDEVGAPESGTAGPSPESESADVIIHLKPIGSAPKLKIKKFKVPRDRSIAAIHAKVKKMLGFGDDRTLFLHVDKFVPSPDETVDNLYRLFGSAGTVALGYCEEVAFG